MIPRNKHSGYIAGIRLYPGWGPEAPDMSGSNDAARTGAGISKEQWEWTKARQPKLDEQADAMIAMGRDQYNLNREGQEFQQGLMRRQDNRYWDDIAPMEDRMFAEARNFNTNARREELAGTAMADVNQAFGQARRQGAMARSRMGFNPTDGQTMADNTQMDIAQANAIANAANKTRTAARLEGLGRTNDAIAMGKGMSGFNSNTMAAFGSGALSASGLGMNGLGASANIYNSGASSAAQGLQSASSNLRSNAIESARNPGFDAAMGLAAGGLSAYGQFLGKS